MDQHGDDRHPRDESADDNTPATDAAQHVFFDNLDDLIAENATLLRLLAD